MAYATVDDVAAATGATYTDTQVAQLTSWLTDAGLLIDGYLCVSAPDPAPEAYKQVSINMAVRALAATDSGVTPGATAQLNVAGPFTQQTQFSAQSTTGGVWLSASDKLMLRPYRQVVTSIPLGSERSP